MNEQLTETAKLRAELQIQINKVPQRIQQGSINATRAWMAARQHAIKVLKKKSASSSDLQSALNSIQ